MSAHQMICHVSDSFRMLIGQKAVSEASGLPQRTVLKWIALYAPLRWPAGVMTRPEVDQELTGTRPGEFECDLDQLEALMEQVTSMPAFKTARHPIFGPMSHAAWLRWGYLHMDHHLRQFGS
jgi:hypothetical protein